SKPFPGRKGGTARLTASRGSASIERGPPASAGLSLPATINAQRWAAAQSCAFWKGDVHAILRQRSSPWWNTGDAESATTLLGRASTGHAELRRAPVVDMSDGPVPRVPILLRRSRSTRLLHRRGDLRRLPEWADSSA